MLGVVLALARVLLFPAAARAGCGDDMVIQRPGDAAAPAAKHSLMDQLMRHEAAARSGGCPCSGPHCSSAPASAPAQPTVPSPPPEEWGIPEAAAPQGTAASTPFLSLDGAARATLRPFVLERPPR